MEQKASKNQPSGRGHLCDFLPSYVRTKHWVRLATHRYDLGKTFVLVWCIVKLLKLNKNMK